MTRYRFAAPATLLALALSFVMASAGGTLRFLINGQLFADYTGLDNDTLRVERSLLGAVSGVDTNTRGTLYFDGFTSRQW